MIGLRSYSHDEHMTTAVNPDLANSALYYSSE